MSDTNDAVMGLRSGPGVLLFSSSLNLIHMDRQAWDLCRAMARAQQGDGKEPIVPKEVKELGNDILHHLSDRNHPKDWEEFQARRVIDDPERPILLRRVGLADADPKRIRILIMMEEAGHRQGNATQRAKEVFNLTAREQAVVQHLLKGYTNKQIAQQLGITEQTVKEHIKHIMQKTKVTTRTGILVEIMAQETPGAFDASQARV